LAEESGLVALRDQRAPVDAGLEAGIELDLDHFRFEHDLARDGRLRLA
jgi:hypothetical protein